ncbi:alpha-E domain-containing protein [Opitutaceae bacterium TAV4]|uniref:alpha-E domain-containing protein n=1 Tax=Geminisphaera colitermitum TaxID=1148786 RepID=UPI000158C639|nr:alpha-E domain-containing protein [Geminisphaera colitermitum]RRJ95827.1 alpha-E domain-containing protein [Opitutaceae bacterium TAV4]RRJ99177.1 alpha-E domain-containing protein [Opitutaceae bacterium TAV3]
MLSRVANSLYWMSRYLERAENTARLVDVNLQLLLDFRDLDDHTLTVHWMPIVQSSGDETLFTSLHPRATGEAVTEFMVFQTENTNSVLSSVSQARENARMVRDQITVELWEELNRLYLFLRSPRARQLLRSAPSEFFQEIKAASLYLQGLTDAIVVRNEGWHFIHVGKYLERADKTSRILDVRHNTIPPRGIPGPASPADVHSWSAILRSCSAWDAYQYLHGADVQPAGVAELLLLSDSFPRSVRFCIQQLNAALRSISGVAEGRFSNDAEKLAGRLLAELQFNTVTEIFETGLHSYIDLLQTRLNAIGGALFNTYILHAFQEDETDRLRQQEEQQQQESDPRHS